MKIQSLTPAEEHLMQTLWRLKSAYMREVMAHLPEPKPHQNTVSTFMKILTDKGFLTVEKEGRIYRYHTAIPFTDYRFFKTERLIEDYYAGSAENLVEDLAKHHLLDKDIAGKDKKKEKKHKKEKKKKL